MSQSIERRVEILEGQQQGREQVIVMCLPGGEEEALRQHMAEHPEHGDAERFEIVLVCSGISRAPIDPLPEGAEAARRHGQGPVVDSVQSAAPDGRCCRRNEAGGIEEIRNSWGQDEFHTDPGPFPYRR